MYIYTIAHTHLLPVACLLLPLIAEVSLHRRLYLPQWQSHSNNIENKRTTTPAICCHSERVACNCSCSALFLRICCACYYYSGFTIVVAVVVFIVAAVVVAQRDSCHNCARSSMVAGLQANICTDVCMYVYACITCLQSLVVVVVADFIVVVVCSCLLSTALLLLLFFCETIALLLQQTKTGNRLVTFLTCWRPLFLRLRMSCVLRVFNSLHLIL